MIFGPTRQQDARAKKSIYKPCHPPTRRAVRRTPSEVGSDRLFARFEPPARSAPGHQETPDMWPDGQRTVGRLGGCAVGAIERSRERSGSPVLGWSGGWAVVWWLRLGGRRLDGQAPSDGRAVGRAPHPHIHTHPDPDPHPQYTPITLQPRRVARVCGQCVRRGRARATRRGRRFVKSARGQDGQTMSDPRTRWLQSSSEIERNDGLSWVVRAR